MDLAALSARHLDALREVGNMGAGNAATALSKMLSRPISINVPQAEIVPLERVGELVGGAETLLWAVYVQMAGDLRGHMLFILPSERASLLIDLLMQHEPGTCKIIDEVAESALAEVGNILTTNYLMAIGSLIRLDLRPSPPLTANDMAGAVINGVCSNLAADADSVVAIATELLIAEELDLVGHLFVFPEPSELPKLLDSLGL